MASQRDSTCVVPYLYSPPAGTATITASFTKANPMLGGTGTALKWTTTDAVSVSVTCTGVATYGPANVPVQGNPCGITLNSAVAGVVTCVYTALNYDTEPVTATATATFSPPLPPTINAEFTDFNPSAGLSMPGTSIYWYAANTKTLSVECYNALSDGSTWGNANSVWTQAPGAAVFKSASAKTVTCNFVATNEIGQTANASVTANFYNPPPAVANAWFEPDAIVEGQSSAFHWSTANAVYVGMVCSGVGYSGAWEQTPNQSWYYDFNFSTQGVQECNIYAKNAADVWSAATAQLYVYPAATPSGSVGSPPAPNIMTMSCAQMAAIIGSDCSTDSTDGTSGAGPGSSSGTD